MTAAVILGTFLASMALYINTPWDGYLMPSLFGDWLSFYVLVFLAGLISASAFAVLSRDRRCIEGMAVLWLNFIASHVAWYIGDPNLYFAGVIDLLTLAYFAARASTRWEVVVGFLFLASFGISALSGWIGVIPGPEERVAAFVSFSMPDLTSLCGLMASAVLGFASGDTGRRVRTAVRAPMGWARAAY